MNKELTEAFARVKQSIHIYAEFHKARGNVADMVAWDSAVEVIDAWYERNLYPNLERDE